MSEDTYIKITMEGFSPLILSRTDTIETMLDVLNGDWMIDDPIKMTVGPIDMPVKTFEELPEWEA